MVERFISIIPANRVHKDRKEFELVWVWACGWQKGLYRDVLPLQFSDEFLNTKNNRKSMNPILTSCILRYSINETPQTLEEAYNGLEEYVSLNELINKVYKMQETSVVLIVWNERPSSPKILCMSCTKWPRLPVIDI